MLVVTNSLLFMLWVIHIFHLRNLAHNICIIKYPNQLNMIMEIDQCVNQNQLQISQYVYLLTKLKMTSFSFKVISKKKMNNIKIEVDIDEVCFPFNV